MCVHLYILLFRTDAQIAAQRAFGKDPAQYMVTLEQMIENDYPVPSYMADVFQKPEGWVETPQVVGQSTAGQEEALAQRIYAIDCEMVRVHELLLPSFEYELILAFEVSNRSRQRAHSSLHD